MSLSIPLFRVFNVNQVLGVVTILHLCFQKNNAHLTYWNKSMKSQVRCPPSLTKIMKTNWSLCSHVDSSSEALKDLSQWQSFYQDKQNTQMVEKKQIFWHKEKIYFFKNAIYIWWISLFFFKSMLDNVNSMFAINDKKKVRVWNRGSSLTLFIHFSILQRRILSRVTPHRVVMSLKYMPKSTVIFLFVCFVVVLRHGFSV